MAEDLRTCVKCDELENPGNLKYPDIPRCKKHNDFTVARTCENCGRTDYLYRKTGHTISRICRKCKTPQDFPPSLINNSVRLEYLDVKERKYDLNEWLDHCKQYSNKKADLEISQEFATVRIKTDKPIAVTYSADWHLGSSAVDYASFEANLKFLLGESSLYMAVVGDTIENIVKFRNILPTQSQVMNKEEQHEMLSSILDELIGNNKLLCYGWGNHDVEFDERLIGVSFVKQILAQKKRIPFFAAKGLLKLRIGKQEYTNLIMHKGRFNSYLHGLHTNKRGYELDFPADVVCTAHIHQPAFECLYRYDMASRAGYDFGGQVVLIRTGTYKTGTSDEYAARNFQPGILAMPTVVYFPDTKRAVPFMLAEDAVRFLKSQ